MSEFEMDPGAVRLHRFSLWLFAAGLVVSIGALVSTQFVSAEGTPMTLVGCALILGFASFHLGFVLAIAAFFHSKPRPKRYLLTVLANGVFSIGADCFMGAAAFLSGWQSA